MTMYAQMIQCSLPNCLSGKCLLPLLQPPLFKQTKEEREISEKVVFLQQGSSAFLESQVKKANMDYLHRGNLLQPSLSLKSLVFTSLVSLV